MKKVKSFVVSDKKIFSCFPIKAYVTLEAMPILAQGVYSSVFR